MSEPKIGRRMFQSRNRVSFDCKCLTQSIILIGTFLLFQSRNRVSFDCKDMPSDVRRQISDRVSIS